ncbi:FtsX-like permease family protein [Lachnotalea glycerini]|uniref:ABC transporter permease n=1 Tax=Lachnotalea glycerini TaxID=1763509 RepID=A0A371J9B7_9FIRM|nr:ABC transporter permease [Lachnotalea glycerini]RDY29313.1 ABC transporter permease [Lachnotalea glycerini]
MVLAMNLNSIQRKLMMKDFKNNVLFGLSVAFSIILFGSQGILQFSKTITIILMTGGSTYTITLGMYMISAVGLLCFIIYVNAIHFKMKTRQIGIFMALGVPCKDCSKMFQREFLAVYSISALLGLVLSIPFSWIVWKVLSKAIKTTTTSFSIGWKGIVFAVLYVIISYIMLLIINLRNIHNLDIITILKSETENELVKGNKGIRGICGVIMTIMGIIFFNISAIADNWFKLLMTPFLAIAILGMYYIAVYITFIGDVVKKVNIKRYYKSMLYYNLTKQKGKQYAIAIFVSSILIFVTIFGVCFNSASFFELAHEIKTVPYDFSVMSNFQTKDLNQEKLEELAQESEVKLNDIHQLDLIYLARKYEYKNGFKEWSSCYVTSQSDFEKLMNKTYEIADNNFIAFSNDNIGNVVLDTYLEGTNCFYNAVQQQDFKLNLQEKIASTDIMNSNGSIYEFIVLNDSQYKSLEQAVDEQHKLTYFLFNSNHKSDLHQKILDEILSECNNEMFVNIVNSVANDKLLEAGDKTIAGEKVLEYNSNKLYAARWWDMYPFARDSAMNVQFEIFSVYLIFVFYICIITIISAVIIISSKVISSLWQDAKSYEVASSIGMKGKSIYDLIGKQIRFIYFIPAIIGCLAAILMVNRFMVASSIQSLSIITWASVIYSIVLLVFQCVGYFVVKRIAGKSVAKYIE